MSTTTNVDKKESLNVVEELDRLESIKSKLQSRLDKINKEIQKIKPTKQRMNKNVSLLVYKLFDENKTNQEVLKEVCAFYNNNNTTYACIAWYRNKYNKAKSSN
jgi:predicted nuclease with TOPRIM domain